uniref:NAC domain-containing protein n=1 Tax=Angiostrongylus cantonensis TaxID=6313 RepID=A0A0K0CY30_ANGCA
MTGGTDSVDVNKIQRNPVDSYVKMEQIEGYNGGSTSGSGQGASETLFRSSSTEASSRVVKKEEESWDPAEVENAWGNRATLYDIPNPNTNYQHFLFELAVVSNPETPEASSLLKRTKKSTVQRPKNRKKAGVGSRSKRSSAKKVSDVQFHYLNVALIVVFGLMTMRLQEVVLCHVLKWSTITKAQVFG